MAMGRMIVKSISYDARIRGLSRTARLLWAYILPHTESDGSLPRSAEQLRLMCFPEWDVFTQEVENAIQEWLTAKICSEEGKKLILTEFDDCNKSLYFNRERQKRWKERKVTLPSVTNVTNAGNAGNAGNARIEENRIEENRIEEKTDNNLYISSFEQFWKDYPRKEGRKPALEAWLKLRPEGERLTMLLQALLKYKGSAAVRQGIIFAPARWLAEERWTDEIKEEGNGGDPIYA